MAVALAKIGQSNLVINRDCGLKDGQTNYRLTKAQRLEGGKGGYRRAWANGETPLVRRIKNDYLGVLMNEVQRKLPRLIEHPAPKVKEGR